MMCWNCNEICFWYDFENAYFIAETCICGTLYAPTGLNHKLQLDDIFLDDILIREFVSTAQEA